MDQTLADDLDRMVDDTAAMLRTIPEAAATRKSMPTVWSIKEIVGHLIDSAANNHQRFVRAQQGDSLAWPGYDQEAWVRVTAYQARPWLELVSFWALYNHHLAHVIRRIPGLALDVTCRIGGNEPVTLAFLVEDYVDHHRRHLARIEELVARSHEM